jgi:hypothetical protein
MLSFRDVKRRVKIPGFHCHHLIPLEIVEMPAFRTLFHGLGEKGIDFDNFRQNGMHLPCTEANAAAFRLPLHRGPHPVYNQIVCERIAAMERLRPAAQLCEMQRLQHDLKAALRQNALPLRKQARNPLAPNPGFDTMEAAAFRLWNLLPSH